MRRYRKWVMTLGLVAAAPTVGLAGPLDFFRAKSQAVDGEQNQQVANEVASRLRSARLKGADIEILFENGTLTLKGQVADAGTKALASQLAQGVDGVERVNNQMSTTGKPTSDGAVQQASAETSPFSTRETVQPAAFQSQNGQKADVQQVSAARNAAQSQRQTAMRRPAASQATPSNQQEADQVAAALGRAGLSGFDIQVRCNNGVCTLAGTVSSAAHRDAAIRAAQAVPSVRKIDSNQLRVGAPAAIMQANFQNDGAGVPMGPGGPMPGGAVPPGYGMPPGYGPAPGYGPPAGVAPPPGYAHPGPGAVSPVYDQPSLPEHAWPSYAAYPNYAALTYPRQHSASAWPYIGPFYPYPQVPLGWRKVTLEWDDGHWYLDFNDRTDRWWWFFNPKKW